MNKLILKLLSLTFLVTSSAMLVGNESNSDLELWGTSVSPYVRKVECVLKYKKLEYKQHDILPKVLLEATNQEVPQEFTMASKFGKIPALHTSSGNIIDSAVIVAYLEKRFPENPVYPSCPQKLANILWMEKYSDTVMTDVIHKIFFERVVRPVVLNATSDEEAIKPLIQNELPKILNYLNEKLEKSHYLVGNEPTLADYAVAQHIVNLDASNIEWKNGSYKALESYYKRMLEDKIFSSTIPDILKK